MTVQEPAARLRLWLRSKNWRRSANLEDQAMQEWSKRCACELGEDVSVRHTFCISGSRLAVEIPYIR